MLVARLDENAPPESFAGRLDHAASPLFRSWARETGGSPGKKINNLGQLVKNRYARARIGQILKLTENQFEQACVEVGGDAGWRLTFESFVAAPFTKPAVPCSAYLAQLHAPTDLADDQEAPSPKLKFAKPPKAEPKGPPTLSTILGTKVSSIYVPDVVFLQVTTPSPMINTITPAEVKSVATAWAVWVFSVFGMLNVGSDFRRRCVALIQARLPNIPGKSDWDGIIKRKGYVLDRPDATVCAPCPSCTRRSLP